MAGIFLNSATCKTCKGNCNFRQKLTLGRLKAKLF